MQIGDYALVSSGRSSIPPWPGVIVPITKIPRKMMMNVPNGYYLAVLLMGKLEIAWARQVDLRPFEARVIPASRDLFSNLDAAYFEVQNDYPVYQHWEDFLIAKGYEEEEEEPYSDLIRAMAANLADLQNRNRQAFPASNSDSDPDMQIAVENSLADIENRKRKASPIPSAETSPKQQHRVAPQLLPLAIRSRTERRPSPPLLNRPLPLSTPSPSEDEDRERASGSASNEPESSVPLSKVP
ncbi:hypothetical protein K469DRAFT_371290 [Zopfia rhizophila CBS 207.26]|uniref:PWWP domain-containing protein n=1 Tax=Zopfia rhizophila CBS 207.26 TaxID=1314779 RepID=A0A6A6ENC2_9PEZI|nr:hypothetical protein K469DRAFT_371290 [Zopfia rhizophila CBS 207.26]